MLNISGGSWFDENTHGVVEDHVELDPQTGGKKNQRECKIYLEFEQRFEVDVAQCGEQSVEDDDEQVLADFAQFEHDVGGLFGRCGDYLYQSFVYFSQRLIGRETLRFQSSLLVCLNLYLYYLS